ncbi:RnfH family protein [Robbsia sp. Bb-Pol-6]|uniref:UPF0125 protein OVY01_03335 n=1 Tax=Robbsia betulipollinis TaxID=2981849 RepID=A0ABT3ZID6_9BURK|nr:RnfH family protein [Robbsia betulipollinis]MCY0386293.1 RnfH family protein [Robbsia betulipollinis]
MHVQVCYMTPSVQALIDVELPPGATLAEAIRASGLCARHPEIDLSTQKVGVHGKVRALDERLAAHDRVEICRPLTVDPKLARARRVAKARKGGSVEGRKWANREYR